MSLIKNFWKILSNNQQLQAIFVLVLMISVSILETFGIALVIPIMSGILEQSSSIRLQISSFLPYIGQMTEREFIVTGILFLLIFYLFKAFIIIFYIFRKSKFEANIQYFFSGKLFQKYLNEKYEFHIENNSSFLLRNVTQETDNLKHATNAFLGLLSEAFIMLGIIIFLLFFEPMATTLIIILGLILYLIYSKLLRNRIKYWGDRRYYHAGILTKHVTQGFGIIKILKLMSLEKIFFKKFDEHNLKRSLMYKNYEITLGLPRVILEYFSILGLLLVTIFQLYLGKSYTEILLLLAIYGVSSFKLIPSFNKIIICLQAIQYNRPSLELIFSTFKNNKNNYETGNERKNIEILSSANNLFEKNLIFKNVNFKYKNSEKPILNDINFEIHPKDIFGILGESGAGKSTIIDLIIGLLNPTNGNILIDGKELKLVKANWQKFIGYVPQNIYLNDESIRENITFNRETSQKENEKVIESIKKARIYDFVKSLPEGIETKVGERGVKLSGGQKQRIGIARALYGNPKILVLDEATNQLDEENEIAIIDTIKDIKDVTVIIISHNKSALINCNKIIKIKSGKIVQNDH